MNKRLSFFLLLTALSTAASGCAWDKSTYNELVADGNIVHCPPDFFAYVPCQDRELWSNQEKAAEQFGINEKDLKTLSDFCENTDNAEVGFMVAVNDYFDIPNDTDETISIPTPKYLLEPPDFLLQKDIQTSTSFFDVFSNKSLYIFPNNDKEYLYIESKGNSNDAQTSSIETPLISWADFRDFHSNAEVKPTLSYIFTTDHRKCTYFDCPEFSHAFEYQMCPTIARQCNFNTGVGFYCKAKTIKCNPNEHISSNSGECEADSPKSCGNSETDCTHKTGWKSAECIEGKCVATACLEEIDYALKDGSCIISCQPGKHITSNNECIDDDVNHCGSSYNDCTKLLGWKSGTCTSGQCAAEDCIENFKEVNGICVTNCKEETHYDNEQSRCVADDEHHCGASTNDCTKLLGWKSGTCTSGQCVAEDCIENFKEVNGVCVVMCKDNMHYDNEISQCVADDINHCGSSTNDCTRLSGWAEGECTGGKCVPYSCTPGYHLNAGVEQTEAPVNPSDDDNSGDIDPDTPPVNAPEGNPDMICVADTNRTCGPDKIQCTTGQVCTNGTCAENCADGQVLCSNGSNTSCIDPLTDNTYCGAQTNCTGFDSCEPGKSCLNGTCTQTSCPGTQALCSVVAPDTETPTPQCIDIHTDKMNHCGACNYACADHPMPNATAASCQQGKCQYTCNTGYQNCGSADAPVCLSTNDLKSDPNHCGSCTKTCKSTEYCSNGTCVTSRCAASKACLNADTGECVNTNTSCGPQCRNCNTEGHAETGTCSKGTCTITKCAVGYHLTTSKTCVANTNAACGGQSSTATTNCNTANFAASGICTLEGKCTATSCQDGYHLINGQCQLDNQYECGNELTNCTKLTGWASSSCARGVCQASKCSTGYCKSGNTCVDGSKNSNACGTSGGDCSKCSTNEHCNDGRCVTHACNETTCFYQATTCNNTAEHCGKDCINCNTANHAKKGTCKSGTCTIDECAAGYHKYNGSCEVNSLTACGSHTNNCTTTPGWNTGVCSTDSQCTATSCKGNYHYYNNTCEVNDTNNCGSHGHKCATNEKCSNGNCIPK